MGSGAHRVVIYARGIPAEIEHQRTSCLDMAGRMCYLVVAVASDAPGESDGWRSANRLVEAGEADLILVESRLATPMMLESVTAEMPGRRPRRIH